VLASESQQQQQQAQAVESVKVERATDPRSQPAPSAESRQEEIDPDREFARNGGGQQQQQQQWQGSHDEPPMRESRPNPNKHEDGYVPLFHCTRVPPCRFGVVCVEKCLALHRQMSLDI
jgi:hypothetical protein